MIKDAENSPFTKLQIDQVISHGKICTAQGTQVLLMAAKWHLAVGTRLVVTARMREFKPYKPIQLCCGILAQRQ